MSRNSLKEDFPLCKECVNPRKQDNCRLVTTLAQDNVIERLRSLAASDLCGAPGIDVYVPNKKTDTSWYGYWWAEEKLKMHFKSSAPTVKNKEQSQFQKLFRHSHYFITHLTRAAGWTSRRNSTLSQSQTKTNNMSTIVPRG